MVQKFVHQIQTRVGWPLLAVVALTVVAFAVATGIVMQQQSDEASTVGIAQGGRPGGVASDLAAPEEGLKSGNSAVAPAPAATGFDSNGGTGTSIPTLESGRDIIRTGSIDLEVRSVNEAFEQVSGIATGASGFVADSMFIGSGDEHSAHLTLRVPADRFGEVVTQLRGLATDVRTISSSARDVTGEVSDLEATLRNLRAVEAQYSTLLGRAGSIGDILQVQERLNSVRLQIDRTEARRALIQSQTEMSTLSVSLVPEGTASKSDGGLRDAAVEAWEASLETLQNIATAAVVVLVYSWWIIPLLVLVVVLVRRRAARRPATEAPPAG